MQYLLLLLFLPLAACAQTNFHALDYVPPFQSEFGYGVNLGYFPPDYDDKALAELAHDSIQMNTIRVGLYAHFLEQWGYGIRVPYFKYYKKIGLNNITAMLGFPSDAQRDTAFYDGKNRSALFKNLYEPIWDKGENETPVNDNNPCAVYAWKTATRYKGLVYIYEIWNEPDYELYGNAWKIPGQPGNWWENNPPPAETNLHAPIFHYIRMLRICYEVIKSVDPDALVAVGGLGWPAYLDAICRNTDNPVQGKPSADFPQKGGAYFDCMSYHCYPHLDASTRQWSNEKQAFVYFRHSDAAAAGMWKKKQEFEQVLYKYGFDNRIYPKKHWICTEFNIPRKSYDGLLGNPEAQINFLLKTLAQAPAHELRQMHLYCLADDKPQSEAHDAFAYMGLFKNLKDVKKGRAEILPLGIAYQSFIQLLGSATYDSAATHTMHIPPDLEAYAFTKTDGNKVFVMWARTRLDASEAATGSYRFPAEFRIQNARMMFWDFAQTHAYQTININKFILTGQPVFILPDPKP